MSLVNKRVLVAKRAVGVPTSDCFELVETGVPICPSNGMLVQVMYATVDPGMRGWLAGQTNYMTVADGEVMRSHGVGEIIESNHADWAVGEIVVGWLGWQTFAAVRPEDLLWKVDIGVAPASAWIGVLGLNGITAWVGLNILARPKPKETIVVTTAAGSVGGAVGELAGALGLHTVGLTSTLEKAEYGERELGYSKMINYRSIPNVHDAVSAACPNGVDVFFDNTAGDLADEIFPCLNVGARIIQCGTASIASWDPIPAGRRREREILTKRLCWQGMVVFDHSAHFEQARTELAALLRAGKITSKEHVLDGLANAPSALELLFTSRNSGRLLIKI